jgi:hypothetical protein
MNTPATQHTPHCRATKDPQWQWEGDRDPRDARRYICHGCGRSIEYQQHHSKVPPDIFEAFEHIDASMFSGDAFYDDEAATALEKIMARWARGLASIRAINAEVEAAAGAAVDAIAGELAAEEESEGAAIDAALEEEPPEPQAGTLTFR